MSYYVFFDTETVGLPRNYKAPSSDIDNWPRLVQIAWQIYGEHGTLYKEKSYIIKPDGFTIPEASTNVHGITTELALEKGVDIINVLHDLKYYAGGNNIFVAHNMQFDQKIVGAELIRMYGNNFLANEIRICTMLNTVDVCQIPGRYGFKWPKLIELYKRLFDSEFEGAHDALVDVKAMVKCFWYLKHEGFNFEDLESYT